MIIFTVVPVILIGYYAFTDQTGAFTLDNFKNFWDSSFKANQDMLALQESTGIDLSAYITRGTVNVDTLVYSLWMAFLCTAICLLLGYPAALFMADRKMKLGPTLIVLFIIPMWMNFLLRTIAWMSLLEDSGLINTFLKWLGFEGVQLMYNSNAVLLGMVYNFLPFMVFPIYTVLAKMDFRLTEAALEEIGRAVTPAMSDPLTNNMVCAGEQDGARDACQGDSGGPLFIDQSGKPVQVGIVSWGEGPLDADMPCGHANAYGIYTRVANYKAWISEKTGIK
jgi:ABC-type spermidine/putrescine transport system permease subunit II